MAIIYYLLREKVHITALFRNPNGKCYVREFLYCDPLHDYGKKMQSREKMCIVLTVIGVVCGRPTRNMSPVNVPTTTTIFSYL